MACCNNIYDLGCASACNTVDIISSAAGSDTYTIKAFAGFGTIEATQTVTAGNPIQIDNSGLDYQPGYTYRISILDSTGAEVTDTIDSVEYNCWKLTFENTFT